MNTIKRMWRRVTKRHYLQGKIRIKDGRICIENIRCEKGVTIICVEERIELRQVAEGESVE